jgi:hypothetical protein
MDFPLQFIKVLETLISALLPSNLLGGSSNHTGILGTIEHDVQHLVTDIVGIIHHQDGHF